MEIYINGTGNISPQNTINNGVFLEDITESTNNLFSCIEPVYKEYIPVKLLRRMSKILKLSIASSKIALQDAGADIPEAINTSTGLGCMADTEKFLNNIIENDESLLNPTAFIQSTHNTIGGQIALILGVHGHNYTYTQGFQSFESALLDSSLLILNGDANNVLVGAVDESTPDTHIIKDNIIKKQLSNDSDSTHNSLDDIIQGEGSSFFVLDDKKSENSYCKLRGIEIIYNTNSFEDISSGLVAFLKSKSVNTEDIDLLITGNNGHKKGDEIYQQIGSELFQNQIQARYKNLCGEYMTASSFALWLGAKIIKHQNIPSEIRLNHVKKETIQNILIYNCHINTHSFILITD